MFQYREAAPHEEAYLDKVIGMIESIPQPDLRCHMVKQIISAQNSDQLAAAVEMVSEVVAKGAK
jgi:hypothetical protein